MSAPLPKALCICGWPTMRWPRATGTGLVDDPDAHTSWSTPCSIGTRPPHHCHCRTVRSHSPAPGQRLRSDRGDHGPVNRAAFDAHHVTAVMERQGHVNEDVAAVRHQFSIGSTG